MSNYTGSFTTVNVNGDFNGWCGACNPLTDMGSGIWEVTLPIAADSMDYKFTVDGWNDQENFAGGEPCTKTKGGFTNRYLRILGDTAVGTVCWNSCSICSSCDGLIDSVQTINVAQGVYRVHLNGPFACGYKLHGGMEAGYGFSLQVQDLHQGQSPLHEYQRHSMVQQHHCGACGSGPMELL